MLLTEYNEAEAMKLFEMDGVRKGRTEKTVEDARAMYDDGLELERIARILKMDLAYLRILQ